MSDGKDLTAAANRRGVGHRSRRGPLSCLPCRRHRLKCDRKLPCQSCVRWQRTAECAQNPAAGASTQRQTSRDKAPLHPVQAVFTLHVQHAGLREPPIAGPTPQVTVATPKTRAFTPGPRSMPIFSIVPTNNFLSLLHAQTLPDKLATETFWRAQLVALLPTRNQTDMLVTFFMDNINLIFSVIHEPSFRKAYYHFWETSTRREDTDLIWLALLFTMLSLSATYMPKGLSAAVGMEALSIQKLAHTWHSASRQALHAGGFESKPQLNQLAVFINSQLYWYAVADIETRNACFAQAVHSAQMMRLDRDNTGANSLETEMRRRLWWELWVADADRSLNYGRTPLIQTRPDRISLPANCNDIDITDTSVTSQPQQEATDTSAAIVRAKYFKIFHRLFDNDRDGLHSWEHVSALDCEIQALEEELPWFFRQSEWDSGRPFVDHSLVIPHAMIWQHYVIHSSVRIQRLRMMRPFLATQPAALEVSTQAAREALDSYKTLRSRPMLRSNPKFQITAHQAYSGAVQLAAFLLVERVAPDELRHDLEMVIHDLKDNALDLPMASAAHKLLERMLWVYDQRTGGEASEVADSIAPEIGPVFGGEASARDYLQTHRSRPFEHDANATDDAFFGAKGLFDLFDADWSTDQFGLGDWMSLFQDTGGISTKE